MAALVDTAAAQQPSAKQAAAGQLPTFLHIGPSKAGSTWIFKVLRWHPEIYVYSGKSLGFFSSHFENGLEWYRSQFDPEPHHRAIGEVSHSYLPSEDAPRRIHEHLPNVKLLLCLRDPVQRTFSDYLDGIKNGKLSGSLEEELERAPGLINKSRYGTHLARYLRYFDRGQIHIACFDELEAAPELFAARMFEFLGVERVQIPPNLQGKVMPAGTPRVRSVATAAKKLSMLTKRTGLNGVRGKLKTSRVVRNLLYRPYAPDARPTIEPTIEGQLREFMTAEVQLLDSLAGTNFCHLWNYRRREVGGGPAA